MRPFAAFERLLERVLERPTARLFHEPLQPVQLQRRIERAMENERMTAADRTLVPNRYAVHLHPADLSAFEDFAGSLAGELADSVLTYARARRFTLADRPRVALLADDSVAPGDIRVASRFVDPPPDEPPDGAAYSDALAEAAGQTRVFQIPVVSSPHARLRVIRPDGTEDDVRVDGSLLTVGRAHDNGLVLHDPRASRYHLRLQARSGTLVLVDLGSTNGTRVNGQLIEEVALGPGDQIRVGDTILIVESGFEP